MCSSVQPGTAAGWTSVGFSIVNFCIWGWYSVYIYYYTKKLKEQDSLKLKKKVYKSSLGFVMAIIFIGFLSIAVGLSGASMNPCNTTDPPRYVNIFNGDLTSNLACATVFISSFAMIMATIQCIMWTKWRGEGLFS